jgi:hypothetical protein
MCIIRLGIGACSQYAHVHGETFLTLSICIITHSAPPGARCIKSISDSKHAFNWSFVVLVWWGARPCSLPPNDPIPNQCAVSIMKSDRS